MNFVQDRMEISSLLQRNIVIILVSAVLQIEMNFLQSVLIHGTSEKLKTCQISYHKDIFGYFPFLYLFVIKTEIV